MFQYAFAKELAHRGFIVTADYTHYNNEIIIDLYRIFDVKRLDTSSKQDMAIPKFVARNYSKMYSEPFEQDSDLIVDGYWQNAMYWTHCPKSYFKLDAIKTKGVVIHFRCPDNRSQFNSFYQFVINRVIYRYTSIKDLSRIVKHFKKEHKSLTVVSSKGTKLNGRSMSFEGVTFLGGNSLIEDFRMLLGAETLVIAASTLSWWAAYLSATEDVYCPRLWAPRFYMNYGICLEEWKKV